MVSSSFPIAHADAAAEMDLDVSQTIAGGEKLATGNLEIEAVLTPGHAAGHVAFLVNGTDVFTVSGRPIAIISNVTLEYRPAPARRTPARR